MKREAIELSPEPRRRARLEAQATYMMSLPRDIRTMIMMKLEPYQQYMLYKEVSDDRFKKWCDGEFWSYALPREFPEHALGEGPEMTKHPRWRYFTYVIYQEIFSRKKEIFFGKDVPNGLHVSVEMNAFHNTSLAIRVSRNWPAYIMWLLEKLLTRNKHVPLVNIGTFTDPEEDTEIHFTIHEDARRICFELIFNLFSKGFSWYKYLDDLADEDQENYEINCHICGKVATGYAAEDPTKLLCGPACK